MGSKLYTRGERIFKWVSAPYNVDGWRLDVAADLGHSNDFNHQFWKDLRLNLNVSDGDRKMLNGIWDYYAMESE